MGFGGLLGVGRSCVLSGVPSHIPGTSVTTLRPRRKGSGPSRFGPRFRGEWYTVEDGDDRLGCLGSVSYPSRHTEGGSGVPHVPVDPSPTRPKVRRMGDDSLRGPLVLNPGSLDSFGPGKRSSKRRTSRPFYPTRRPDKRHLRGGCRDPPQRRRVSDVPDFPLGE